MLIAQVLSTNAFYRAVMQERGLEPREATETGRNNTYTFENTNFKNKYNNSTDFQNECNETIFMLEKMIKALEREVNEIKSKIN